MAYCSNSFITRFPRDIQREILLRLPYDDVLCLSQDPEFAWISKDAEYWSKRANVKRRKFANRVCDYPKLYLELRYTSIITELLSDARPYYGSTLDYRHFACALHHVLQDTTLQPDVQYEFTRYSFVLLRDWNNLVSACLDSIARHPKILKWVSSLGVRTPEYHIYADTLLSAYKSGGIDSVKCLDSIAMISWRDAIVVGDAYHHVDLMRYIVEGKKVDKAFLGRTYINAVRDEFLDVAEYLEPHVGEEDKRLAEYKLRHV